MDTSILKLTRALGKAIGDQERSTDYDAEPQCRPYEEARILDPLSTEGGHADARAFLLGKDPVFATALRRFESTSTASTFSPWRPLEDYAYYVETSTSTDLNVLLPTYDADQRQYSFSTSHVVHVGPKGSGKTTAQNTWLHRNHNELEKMKVMYVRCDAPKLFDTFVGLADARATREDDRVTWNASGAPTIEEYLLLQFIGIIAKVSSKRTTGMIVSLLKELAKSGLTFQKRLSRVVDGDQYETMPVNDFIRDTIGRTLLRHATGGHTSYIRDVLFKQRVTRHREFNRWIDCARATKQWMIDNGYFFIWILDGVDNLHLNTDVGRRTSEAFRPELISFLRNKNPQPTSVVRELYYVTMRHRTWAEVCEGDPLTSGGGTVSHATKLDHCPPKFKEVFDKRNDWIREKVGDLHFKITLTAASMQMEQHNSVFHDNIRNAIVSVASLAAQIRFRWHQLRLHGDLQAHCQTQARNLVRRNLLLNGRFYLKTAPQWPEMNREKGLAFLNPFWGPDKLVNRGGVRKNLLLRVRLLETVCANDGIREDHLVSFLVQQFAFDGLSVKEALVDARAFGWIDSEGDDNNSHRYVLSISESGRFYLDELLCDLNVLYVCALDTKMPRRFVTQGLVLVHKNHLHVPTGYISAAIVTVLTFLTWLSPLNAANLRNHSMSTHRFEDVRYRQIFLSKKHNAKLRHQIFDLLKQHSLADETYLLEALSKLSYL
jgi:hypothetical protein